MAFMQDRPSTKLGSVTNKCRECDEFALNGETLCSEHYMNRPENR